MYPGRKIEAPPSANAVYPLHLPLPPEEEKDLKPHPIFSVESMNVHLESHASVLRRGCSPHPSHAHDERDKSKQSVSGLTRMGLFCTALENLMACTTPAR